MSTNNREAMGQFISALQDMIDQEQRKRQPLTASSPIDESLRQQELAMARLVSDLRNNNKLGEFYAARKSELLGSVLNEHSDTFQKIYGDLGRASAANNNAMYYYVRNKDLNTLEEAIVNKSGSEAKAATHDSQLAKRQFEVNEWTANNKLDTLFVFQMILIALAVTGPMIYLNRMNIIPMTVITVVLGLVYLAILFTIVVRAQYTNYSRDKRYWNRRVFKNMGGPPFTTPTCITPEGIAGSLDQLGDSIATQYESLGNRASATIRNYAQSIADSMNTPSS